MSWRSDTAQLIAGKWVSSVYPGHGILGSVVRATLGAGENGAAPLYDDWDSAADDNKEFRLLIERWPVNGTLTIGEDSVLSYSGTADYATGRLFVDGADLGAETIGFFGGAPGSVSITGFGGIASSEAFGTASITTKVQASVTGFGGIASGEAFGTASISTNSAASVSGFGGIPSGEAFGVATVTVSASGTATVTSFGGIPSSIAFGVPTINVTLDPSAVTLIVENGTGMADSESYASAATADAYHAARGNAAWASLTQLQKEIALRKATDYMQQQYGGKWSGIRLSSAQALDWPRSNVRRDGYELASAPLPREVVRACCELALRASTSALSTDAGPQVVREKVGAIEVEYANGARQQIKFAAVDNLLRPLMSSASSGLTFVRS